MKKEVRFLWLFLGLVGIMTSNGCRHQPAYIEMDANRSSSTRNQNTDDKSGTTPASAAAELPPSGASQPADAQPATKRFKSPTFMDASGAIRDLPNYPRSTRTNVQIGPNQGLNVMTLLLQTGDSMDLITSFYQKAIKDNQWTVVDRVIDAEQSEWILKKDEENSARIQVKRNPTTRKTNIAIVRGEKLEETSK